MPSQIDFNPFDSATLENPYPIYQALRETDPYHLSERSGELLLTRYDDVDALLRDARRFSNERGPSQPEAPETDLSILVRDPPDHTRLRSLVSRAFTPRRISTMEDHIRDTAHALLDEVAGQDEFDLMSNLAALLPTVVIAEMIGVPLDDRENFKAWSDQYIRIGDPSTELEDAQRSLEAAHILYDYFSRQVALRRQDPADDLITRLITAKDDADQLSEHEMITTLILLLLAGNETTTNLIGNGLKALLEHPQQMHILREHPELMENAIEELVRYDSPVQLDPRIAAEPARLGDKTVEPGQFVVAVIGAANRDPQVFNDPETLDITREDVGSISFGRGVHFCLGAPLARLEGRIAFECLLERFDQIEFGTRRPVHRRNFALRGLQHFDIRVQRRPSVWN